MIDLSDVPPELRRAVAAALTAAGMEDGHIAIDLVGEGKMRTLNYAHRGVDEATDVIAFPVDGPDGYEGSPGPRELGDVFICPTCGNIEFGIPTEKCPICGEAAHWYQKVA